MGDYPLDKYAVKKIRANIIDGNRELAKSYHFLDDWVLKAIEENELFPEAQPDVCSRCNHGIMVFSIGGCSACYHCSNKECDNQGCSNFGAGTDQPTRLMVALPKDPALEFIECDACRKKPGSPTLCHGCLHNRSMASLLNVPFVTWVTEESNK